MIANTHSASQSSKYDNVESASFDEIEGLETSESVGWGEYPLDSVFVRTEQRTVSEVVKRIKADRFILHPDFQRDFVWDVKKQSRLIESCLMRIPLPVLYVAEAKDGRIIVVDGLQRLTTFLRYLSNEFPLSKLGNSEEESPQANILSGKKFDDLPLNLKERIEDTQLTLYILDSKAPQRAKLDIFERVNSGEPLARQQMRNCLFNGAATKWLAEIAESSEFIRATGNSLNKKTMRDREVINRFCAFKILGVNAYNGDMDDFLAKALEEMNTFSEDSLESMANSFKMSMEINYQLFGKHSFRKSLASENPSSADRTVINIALFDVCSVLFSSLEFQRTEENSKILHKLFSDLLKDEAFKQAITISTNGSKQVNNRFRMLYDAVNSASPFQVKLPT